MAQRPELHGVSCIRTSMTLPQSELRDHTSSALDYAPAERPSRWRAIRRAALWIAVAAIVVLAVRRGPDFSRRFVFLYHQRGCLQYTAAPDQVVFDSNPARVAILATDPNFAIVSGCAFRKPPAGWSAVRARVALPICGRSAVLFLHKRVVGGNSRLIVVEQTGAYFIPGYMLGGLGGRRVAATIMPSTLTATIEPATLNSEARDIAGSLDPVMDAFGPHADFRIFAGQPDPADDSRFTIRYELDGKSHLLEGRIAAHGPVEFHRTGE